MANKHIVGSAVASQSFVSSLDTLSQDVVHANAPSARKMVGRTSEALNRLRDAAKADGYESGFKAGYEAGEAEARQFVEAMFVDAAQEFAQVLQEKSDQVFFAAKGWADQSERQLAELATMIAAKILEQEIRLGHDTITEIAKSAIKEVLLAESIRVRVNPFDVPIVEERKQALLAVNKQLRSIEIVEDPSILGGCIVESDAGIVDASLQTKLSLVFDAMSEAA